MASSATASQDPLPVPASRAVVVPAAEVPVVEPPSPCGVGVGALLQIRKAPVPGRPHPLADVLAVVSKNGKTHKDKADSHAHRIAHTMLGSNVVHLSSNACFSEALKVSRHILLPRQKTVAAASFVASRQAKWNLEAALLHSARGRVEGVAYVECARYDETPMRVRAAGQSSASTVPLLALPASSSSSSLVPTSQAWAPSLGEQATTSSSAGKILQSELRYGILLKSGACFFGIVGSQLCHLQLLERCTTRCMLSAQMALSAATPYCAFFRHRLRLSTTDRHASNLACERVLSQNMGDSSFSLIHQTCDVHVVSRIHTRVFSMVQEHITGLLRHSLSLSVSANMNLFRRAIRLEIHRRGGVKLIQGQPPLSAQQYRWSRTGWLQHWLATCLSSTRGTVGAEQIWQWTVAACLSVCTAWVLGRTRGTWSCSTSKVLATALQLTMATQVRFHFFHFWTETQVEATINIERPMGKRQARSKKSRRRAPRLTPSTGEWHLHGGGRNLCRTSSR